MLTPGSLWLIQSANACLLKNGATFVLLKIRQKLWGLKKHIISISPPMHIYEQPLYNGNVTIPFSVVSPLYLTLFMKSRRRHLPPLVCSSNGSSFQGRTALYWDVAWLLMNCRNTSKRPI